MEKIYANNGKFIVPINYETGRTYGRLETNYGPPVAIGGTYNT